MQRHHELGLHWKGCYFEASLNGASLVTHPLGLHSHRTRVLALSRETRSLRKLQAQQNSGDPISTIQVVYTWDTPGSDY